MQESLWRSDEFDGLRDCHISIVRNHFSKKEADHFLSLLKNIQWTQNEIVVFGKKYLEPRQTAWYGNAGVKYSYSGIERESKFWTPFLEEIRDRIQEVTESSFNSVLLNRYRNEKDSVAWHADDEKELGDSPTIASVSFGASRKFQLRYKNKKDGIFSIFLHHGDLMIMDPPTQAHYLHCVPKSSKRVSERINLTFRKILQIG
jgi:alkylated DNA repair dioxygenase AlkB